MATKLWAKQPRNHLLNPGRGEIYLSSRQHLERIWSSRSVLWCRCRDSNSRDLNYMCADLTSGLHVVQKLFRTASMLEHLHMHWRHARRQTSDFEGLQCD